MFCENKVLSNRLLIAENKNAFALVQNEIREGHCTVILKKHRTSISQMSNEESADLFDLVKQISQSLENIYKVPKTYLFTISDVVEHLHFHLIPKHENKCSMGEYTVGKLLEAEGKLNKTPEENDALKLQIQKNA